jgi:hypothetical protein
VRGHWGIESMHWVLDVNFREDESRTRKRTLGNNLSWLRGCDRAGAKFFWENRRSLAKNGTQ